MEIKVIKTYKDAEQTWLGLEQEGHRRKLFRAVDQARLGAKNIVAGDQIMKRRECYAYRR